METNAKYYKVNNLKFIPIFILALAFYVAMLILAITAIGTLFTESDFTLFAKCILSFLGIITIYYCLPVLIVVLKNVVSRKTGLIIDSQGISLNDPFHQHLTVSWANIRSINLNKTNRSISIQLFEPLIIPSKKSLFNRSLWSTGFLYSGKTITVMLWYFDIKASQRSQEVNSWYPNAKTNRLTQKVIGESIDIKKLS
jgi:hypothetical protein